MDSLPFVKIESTPQMCTLTPDQFSEVIASLVEAQFWATAALLLILPLVYEFGIRALLKKLIAAFKFFKGIEPSLATSDGYFWYELEGDSITAKTKSASDAWWLLQLRETELGE